MPFCLNITARACAAGLESSATGMQKQALLPAGGRRLANPRGTAPGFALSIGDCRLFFLPGVPREMRRMLRAEVLPEIDRRYRLYVQHVPEGSPSVPSPASVTIPAGPLAPHPPA